jgi:holin-like protein
MTGLTGLAWLLVLQAVGEGIASALSLPIPGPVLGLGLLWGLANWRRVREPVQVAAELLLSNLSLLFVPVGVGIVTHLDLVAQHGVQLMVVLVVSTWIGMAVTAWTLRALSGTRKGQEAGRE